MRTLVVALPLLGLGAAPAPTGPVEVHLSPLVGVREVTLSVTIRFEGGKTLEDWRPETSGPPLTRQAAVKWAAHLAEVLREGPAPFDVEAVKDAPLLLTKGYKGKGVKSVECKAVGLPKEKQPKVRRLKEEKK
jgi:hypothetical protein